MYVVMEEFDHLGRVYRETDEERADRETLIRDLIAGRYGQPVRIVAFNGAGVATCPKRLHATFRTAPLRNMRR